MRSGGGVIKVSTDDDTVIPAAGWEGTINQQYQQVHASFTIVSYI